MNTIGAPNDGWNPFIAWLGDAPQLQATDFHFINKIFKLAKKRHLYCEY